MLLKHIEKIQQKSDAYKQIYTMSVSVFVTVLVASVWAVSALTLNSDKVVVAKDTLDNLKEVSPATVIKSETGNIFYGFISSVKSFTGKTFFGDKLDLNIEKESIYLSPKDDVSNIVGAKVFSTTTSSGLIIETDNTDVVEGVGIITPNE